MATVPTFRNQQRATDFGSLLTPGGCLPSNFDGVTERLGQFLILEVKRGENLTEGQRRLLVAAARVPENTVVLVHSKYNVLDSQALSFEPVFFRLFSESDADFGQPNYEGGSHVMCLGDEFHQRYTGWVTYPNALWWGAELPAPGSLNASIVKRFHCLDPVTGKKIPEWGLV